MSHSRFSSGSCDYIDLFTRYCGSETVCVSVFVGQEIHVRGALCSENAMAEDVLF